MSTVNKMNFFKNKTVLLIDDCQMILNATRSMFVNNGCIHDNIYLAKDAKMALSACVSRSYDFILCDYNLGSGSDGLQLLEQMHQRKLISEQTVIFVITGEMSKSVFYGFAEYEPDGYLIKPINIAAISNRLVSGYRQKQIVFTIRQTHKTKGAEQALKLCDKYEDSKTITFARADILIKEGKAELAQKLYVKLINNKVDEARIKLAKLLISQQKYDIAIKLVEAIINDKKLRFEALAIKALCYLNKRNVVLAQESLKEISAISSNSVERLLTQYNLALYTQDTDGLMGLGHKINSIIKNSIWYSVDHCLLAARSLLFAAENNPEISTNKQLLVDFHKHVKLIEKQFYLAQYKWHRELLLCRYNLLIGNIKNAENIWAEYLQGKEEEDITDFYFQLDVVYIARHLGNLPAVKHEFGRSELQLSQQLVVEKLEKDERKKLTDLGELKNKAAQYQQQNESMKAINQWLIIWKLQPFDYENALSLIKGFSQAIPMDKPINQLKLTYQQALETVKAQQDSHTLPTWFAQTNREVNATLNALEKS